MSKPNSRAIAAKIMASLLRGKGSLNSHLARYRDLEDYSLLQELCFGCARWHHQLAHVLAGLLNTPLKSRDRDIETLLIVGLYQLRELATPAYAATNETVEAAAALGKPWARPLINGVLRNFIRNRERLEQDIRDAGDAVASSHPTWLVTRILQQWPRQAECILTNNNARPPLTLRVNQQRQSRQTMLQRLKENALEATPGALAASAVYLQEAVPVSAIPGFDEGHVSVQDESSQLVPELLELRPGQRVLDACAAPGGKTCHILETPVALDELVALDADAARLSRLGDNLQRLGLSATVRHADAQQTAQWWDGRPFERILLDAPCSATGVIRRHPDIKLLRTAGQLQGLAAAQTRLLATLWPCLRPGGLLLYTTCSILEEENDAVIGAFLQQTADAESQGIDADWGVKCRHGRQLTVGARDGPDGFFYALLSKPWRGVPGAPGEPRP